MITTDDREEVWYATIEDLRSTLVAAPELEGLLGVAGDAVASYDPEAEAIVLDSRYEAVSLFLVRADEVVTLGTLAFVTPS